MLFLGAIATWELISTQKATQIAICSMVLLCFFSSSFVDIIAPLLSPGIVQFHHHTIQLGFSTSKSHHHCSNVADFLTLCHVPLLGFIVINLSKVLPFAIHFVLHISLVYTLMLTLPYLFCFSLSFRAKFSISSDSMTFRFVSFLLPLFSAMLAICALIVKFSSTSSSFSVLHWSTSKNSIE